MYILHSTTKSDNIPPNFTGIIECSNGTKIWCLEGKCHRLDGPAIEYSDGTKFWYIDGKRHRLDGPAIEYPDGLKEWFIDDKHLTETEYKFYVESLNKLATLDEKLVEVDGKKYKMILVQA